MTSEKLGFIIAREEKQVKKAVVIAIIIIGTVLALYIFSRTPPRKSPSLSLAEEPPREETALVTKGIHHKIMEKGRINWELISESAWQFEEGKRVEMEPVELIAYDEEEKMLLKLRAKRGELDLNTNNVLVEGEVVIISAEGVELATERLEWLAKEEKLVTDEEIVMSKGNILIKGRGLEVSKEMEKIEIKENVRIEIKEDKED